MTVPPVVRLSLVILPADAWIVCHALPPGFAWLWLAGGIASVSLALVLGTIACDDERGVVRRSAACLLAGVSGFWALRLLSVWFQHRVDPVLGILLLLLSLAFIVYWLLWVAWLTKPWWRDIPVCRGIFHMRPLSEAELAHIRRVKRLRRKGVETDPRRLNAPRAVVLGHDATRED